MFPEYICDHQQQKSSCFLTIEITQTPQIYFPLSRRIRILLAQKESAPQNYSLPWVAYNGLCRRIDFHLQKYQGNVYKIIFKAPELKTLTLATGQDSFLRRCSWIPQKHLQTHGSWGFPIVLQYEAAKWDCHQYEKPEFQSIGQNAAQSLLSLSKRKATCCNQVS